MDRKILIVGNLRNDIKFLAEALDLQFDLTLVTGVSFLKNHKRDFYTKITQRFIPSTRLISLRTSNIIRVSIFAELISIFVHRIYRVLHLKNINRILRRLEYFQEGKIQAAAQNIIDNCEFVAIFKLSNYTLESSHCPLINISFHGDSALEAECRELAVSLYPSWESTWTLSSTNNKETKADFTIYSSKFASSNSTTKKFAILPLGVDIDSIHANLDVSLKVKQVLYVGRFSLRKGFPIFLDLAENFQNVKFIAVGIPTDTAIEELRVRNLKNLEIVLNPPRLKLFDIYAKSKFFILPSYFEGFGLSLAEAMMSGCIPLCSSNTFGPDLLENLMSGKLISKHNSIQDYIDKLKFLLSLSNQEVQELSVQVSSIAKKLDWNYGKDFVRQTLNEPPFRFLKCD